MINIIIEEMNTSVSFGYLSSTQLQIMKMRLDHETTYTQLVSIFKLSGRTPLSHCIKRTCLLEPWSGYLSKYDLDLFFTLLERLWMNQTVYIQRDPALFVNMDETMLTSEKKFSDSRCTKAPPLNRLRSI